MILSAYSTNTSHLHNRQVQNLILHSHHRSFRHPNLVDGSQERALLSRKVPRIAQLILNSPVFDRSYYGRLCSTTPDKEGKGMGGECKVDDS